MGYRIRYGRLKKWKWNGVEMMAVQAVAAAWLLALILTVNCLIPAAGAVCAACFEPPEESASAVMAQVLVRGGGVRAGLVAMCRQILEAAGYGA